MGARLTDGVELEPHELKLSAGAVIVTQFFIPTPPARFQVKEFQVIKLIYLESITIIKYFC
jgi:hypothetical protein